jgi:hypothetical protein
MSHSRPDQRHSPRETWAPSELAAAPGDRYLTDGTHLYRELGPLEDVSEQLWLEDCHALAVTLMTHDGASRLRDVTPAGPIVAGDGWRLGTLA